MREWIYGRNPVYETLRANERQFYRCLVLEGAKDSQVLKTIEDLCRRNKVPFERAPKQKLDAVESGHQGVLLEASEYPYADNDDIYAHAFEADEPPLFLILDTLQDPQNFGTLLRTAEAVGVHGVFIPQRRAVGVTPAVVNASSGAAEHLLIARNNLANTIKALKKQDVWIVGLEGGEHPQSIEKAPLDQPVALVVGNEGTGLRRLIRESCDLLVSLPMRGKIESLNASVAGSVALYLIFQARKWA